MRFRWGALLLRIFMGESGRHGGPTPPRGQHPGRQGRGSGRSQGLQGVLGSRSPLPDPQCQNPSTFRRPPGDEGDVVIEETNQALLPTRDGMVTEGLATLERVQEVRYLPEGK